MDGVRDDGFLGPMFKGISDLALGSTGLADTEREAFQYYREGLNAQQDGDFSTALRKYAASLKLEEDPVDRSYIYYNLGTIFGNNGENRKAVKYYRLALDANKQLGSAFNNLAIIYFNQGFKAEKEGSTDKAEALYDKAGENWREAVKINPNNYLSAQGWLSETGRMSDEVMRRQRQGMR